MRLNKFYILLLTGLSLFSCKEDDDTPQFEERDRAEQAIADDEAIREFLETHYYNYEEFENPPEDFDYTVRFDSIKDDNADKTAVIDSDKLMVKSVTRDDVEYNLYILRVREGEGVSPKIADSTLVSYQGELLNNSTFDNSTSPVWFDLTRLISGFSEGIVEFKGASGYTVNSDNTVTWNNDFGVGAIIIPSGLGYFSSPQEAIPSYSPLIFNVNLYRVNEADHDNDGIASYLEDLDGDGVVMNDDTDEDTRPNYVDSDDDGDGTPTRDEIIINEDGTVEFPDSNSNGTPDYLDPDTFQ
ncbi:FKBP-type peptidyl-prolyl cis-trans isomerase [Salegentibacter chungangensis]|uniref:Peptidyl-prolyl cis-trans isomerase n=1 Tax=Salegentibacter chungangensis TaxID=1335724 RepID=A0ABW3NTU6_9FLAO